MIKMKEFFGYSGKNTLTLDFDNFKESNLKIKCLYSENKDEIEILDFSMERKLNEDLKNLNISTINEGKRKQLKYVKKIDLYGTYLYKSNNDYYVLKVIKNEVLAFNKNKERINLKLDCVDDVSIIEMIKETILTKKPTLALSNNLATALNI